MVGRVLFFLLVVGGVVGCEGHGSSSLSTPSQKKNTSKVVPIRVAKARLGAITSTITGTCTIEVEEEVDIFTEIGGVVKDAKKKGAQVKRGEVLVRLKDENLQLDLKKSQAEFAKQQASLEIIKKEYEKNLISLRDYQEATHQLALAKIQREQAQVQLEKSVIRAPFPGILTERTITEGQQVFAKTKIFTLVNLDSTLAEVFVSERDIPRVKLGQRAEIFLEASGRTYRGKVKMISPVVDRESGMVEVTLDILPPREGLKVGAFARVTIVVAEQKQVVLIPKKALVYREEKRLVFVLEEGGVVGERTVTLGEESAGKVQILKGIRPGELVVTEGHYNLQKGQKVEIFSPSGKKGE